jgi:hypothetical protein
MKVICDAAKTCTHKSCPQKVEHEVILMLNEEGDYILCSQHPTYCSYSKHDQICEEAR